MFALVKFFFWILIFNSFILSAVLCTVKYPRTAEVSMGTDIVGLIIRLFVIGWITIVLYM